MVDSVNRIEDAGIMVLGSVIYGLESDTERTIRHTYKKLAESNAALAYFHLYRVYPGTKDYLEIVSDQRNEGRPGYRPKHTVKLLSQRVWLEAEKPVNLIRHPKMSGATLLREHRLSWDSFYSLKEIVQRSRRGSMARHSTWIRLFYIGFCLVFKRVYAEHGISDDSVQGYRGTATRWLIEVVASIYRRRCRQSRQSAQSGRGIARSRADLEEIGS